jgi:hypothetical protein
MTLLATASDRLRAAERLRLPKCMTWRAAVAKQWELVLATPSARPFRGPANGPSNTRDKLRSFIMLGFVSFIPLFAGIAVERSHPFKQNR